MYAWSSVKQAFTRSHIRIALADSINIHLEKHSVFSDDQLDASGLPPCLFLCQSKLPLTMVLCIPNSEVKGMQRYAYEQLTDVSVVHY